jgi:hypothetical protein
VFGQDFTIEAMILTEYAKGKTAYIPRTLFNITPPDFLL